MFVISPPTFTIVFPFYSSVLSTPTCYILLMLIIINFSKQKITIFFLCFRLLSPCSFPDASFTCVVYMITSFLLQGYFLCLYTFLCSVCQSVCQHNLFLSSSSVQKITGAKQSRVLQGESRAHTKIHESWPAFQFQPPITWGKGREREGSIPLYFKTMSSTPCLWSAHRRPRLWPTDLFHTHTFLGPWPYRGRASQSGTWSWRP